MKKLIVLGIGVVVFLVPNLVKASLEIYCPLDKEITYAAFQAGKYYDKPVVRGGYYTLYGPWIYKYLNCGQGYVEVRWEILDHYGRKYYCTQTIWVTNPSSPSPISIWCPKETTVYCDQVDTMQYPKPKVTGGSYWLYGPWISKSLNDCGVGSIWVEWKIVDGCGKEYFCKTGVWVKPRNTYAKIWWPKDFEADLCTDNIDPKYLAWPYGYPKVSQENSCAKYGVSYKDEEYYFPNDTGICKKVVRWWTVIDWCTYNPNAYGYNTPGKWTHAQLIKIVSRSKPDITCVPDISVGQESYTQSAWVDIPVPQVTSSCSGKTVITHNSVYATSPGADASGIYPVGKTRVTFTVKDACGNKDTCSTTVTVLDKTAPTPYCIGSLITVIAWHTDGVYTIVDPKKFDLGSYDNLTPKHKLKFEAVPSRFTCDSLGARQVKIWVSDEAGNKDYCTVTLILQDNMGMCPPPVQVLSEDTLFIEGSLISTLDSLIDGVQITVFSEDTTNKNASKGNYKTGGLKAGVNYIIRPSKTGNFLTGVTAADYKLLTDHLQGYDTLDHPYQLLAADINGDDTVDLEDAFLLGAYLLSGSQIPTSQASWRFIPADYDLNLIQLTSNSLVQVPHQLAFNPLTSSVSGADFTGIKIGDLDFNSQEAISALEIAPGIQPQSRTLASGHLEQKNREPGPLASGLPASSARLGKQSVSLFPNPFNLVTTLQFFSPASGQGTLRILDLNGRLIHSRNEMVSAGTNLLRIEGNVLSQKGIYIFNLALPGIILNGKLTYID